MSATELLTYAESRIAELGLGDTPTNCHGVAAYDDAGPGAVRLSDGTGLDAVCRTTDAIDAELAAVAAWYAESK
jgi:hypothetical protein